MNGDFDFSDDAPLEQEVVESFPTIPEADNLYPTEPDTQPLDPLFPENPDASPHHPERSAPFSTEVDPFDKEPTDLDSPLPDPDQTETDEWLNDMAGFTPEEIAAFESLSEQDEEFDTLPIGIEPADDSNAASMDADIPTEEIINIPPEEEVFLAGLEPNTVYEKNGYIYQTDEMGRRGMVSGTLQLEDGIRSSQQTDISKQGIEGDEGGHLIGTRFNGPPDAFNILPQNSELNRGEWKSMENEWASALKDEHEVSVEIAPIYEDDATIRPSSYYVTYWIDGEPHERQFQNQAPTTKG
jgi:hypothetical protein